MGRWCHRISLRLVRRFQAFAVGALLDSGFGPNRVVSRGTIRPSSTITELMTAQNAVMARISTGAPIDFAAIAATAFG